jgi:hypothetical protein
VTGETKSNPKKRKTGILTLATLRVPPCPLW